MTAIRQAEFRFWHPHIPKSINKKDLETNSQP
jgi:hypothetical protein